jgi:hypothetical protein
MQKQWLVVMKMPGEQLQASSLKMLKTAVNMAQASQGQDR